MFLSGTASENSQAGWDLGNRMATGYRFDAKWVCTWEVMPEVSKCSVREMRCHLISRSKILNTSGVTPMGQTHIVKPITPGHPVPKISTRLTISWGVFWKQSTDKRRHQKKRNQKCSIELWTILMFEFCCAVIFGACNEHSINYWNSILKHYWF